MASTGSVWYAAYGSNLWSKRLMAYLQGGSPPGSTRKHRGSSDPSRPREDRPFELPGYRLYFAGDAPAWGGGGVAFLRSDGGSSACSLCRIYRLSVRQFLDVAAQENDLETQEVEAHLTPEALVAGREGDQVALPAGSYGLVLCVGREAGESRTDHPVWTFTGRGDHRPPERAPSERYLKTLCQGLLESYWSPPHALHEYSALERYLLDALPTPEDRKRLRPVLEATKQEFVGEWLQSYPGLVVDRTVDRKGAGRRPIVQLHRNDLQRLGIRSRLIPWLPTYVVVESRHPRKTVRLRAVLHEPRKSVADVSVGTAEASVRKGTVRLDQKIRQALGVSARLQDSVVVRKAGQTERRLQDGRGLVARLTHRLVQRLGGYQPQLMRVTVARYEEMELPVCRIPASSFEVLGIESGDFVVVESLTRRKTLRALEATDKMVQDRHETVSRSPRMENCSEELSLDRTSVPGQDLPLLFIDKDARDELGLAQCDPVYVYRDVVQLLSKELRVLGLTVIVSASIVVFRLGLEVPAQLSIFGAAVVVGLSLVLLRIRKRIG